MSVSSSSVKMLKPKILPKVLNQANTSGVKTTLLITKEGSLLSYAGHNLGLDAIAAIVSNIWSSTIDNKQLEYIIMECSQGKVIVTKVCDLFLCLIGNEMAEFGMLKAKANTLREYLEKPLSEVLL